DNTPDSGDTAEPRVRKRATKKTARKAVKADAPAQAEAAPAASAPPAEASTPASPQEQPAKKHGDALAASGSGDGGGNDSQQAQSGQGGQSGQSNQNQGQQRHEQHQRDGGGGGRQGGRRDRFRNRRDRGGRGRDDGLPDDSNDQGQRLPPPNVPEGFPQYTLSDLKGMPAHKLLDIAEQLQIHEGVARARKQDVIFALLKVLTRHGEGVVADGVLEILPDGFG